MLRHMNPKMDICIEAKKRRIHVKSPVELTIKGEKFSSETRTILFLSTCLISYRLKALMLDKEKIDGDKRIPKHMKEEVKREYEYCCAICANKFKRKNKKKLTIHHIQPKSLGGKSVLDNLIPLCEDCHSRLHEMTHYINRFLKEVYYQYENIKNIFKLITKKIYYYIDRFFEEKPYRKIFEKHPIKI